MEIYSFLEAEANDRAMVAGGVSEVESKAPPHTLELPGMEGLGLGTSGYPPPLR